MPEDEDFETIAGLVADRLEHIPTINEAVIIDGINRDGSILRVQLEVERMDGRRIDRVEMSLLEDDIHEESQS